MQVRNDQLCGVANTILCFVGNMDRATSHVVLPRPRKAEGLTHQQIEADLIGIGAAVTRRPLPHHRAYGSVHGGSSRLR